MELSPITYLIFSKKFNDFNINTLIFQTFNATLQQWALKTSTAVYTSSKSSLETFKTAVSFTKLTSSECVSWHKFSSAFSSFHNESSYGDFKLYQK